MRCMLFFSSLIFFLPVGIIGGKWERVALEGIEVTAVDIIISDNTTEIIVGTRGEGIYRYDTLNSTVTPFYTAYLDSFELFIRNVNTVYIDYIEGLVNYYVGTDSGLCYYFFADDSSHWRTIADIPSQPVTAITGRNDTLFASTLPEIYRSYTGVAKWEPLNADSILKETGPPWLPTFTSLALNDYGELIVYASSMFTLAEPSWAGVLVSQKPGDVWLPFNGGLTASPHSLCFYRTNFSDALGNYACGTDRGVFTHKPMALSWVRLKPGILDSHRVNDLHVTTYSNSDIPEIFACTDTGAYLLSDFPQGSFDNAEWQWLDFDKKTLCAHAIPQNGNCVKFWFVGTEDGLYKYYRDDTDIQKKSVSESMEIPGVYVIDHYNGIRISRVEKVGGTMNVSLLDSRGRVAAKKSAVGESAIYLSKENISPGIYYLHIGESGNVIRRKVTVIK